MPDWLDNEMWAQFLELTPNEAPQGAVGHRLDSMFGYQKVPTPAHLPLDRLSRMQVQDFCKQNADGGSDKDCFLVIAAWGGMNRSHARTALDAWDRWHAVFDEIRSAPDRSAAYEACRALRVRDGNGQIPMPCIGPAYYTKLIVFLAPHLPPYPYPSYIMDQWTAKAIEVLSQDGFALAWNGNQVSDQNLSGDYEEFCQRMDALACLEQGVNLAHLTSEHASAFEARLFSRGGRGRAPAAAWRQQIRDAWNGQHDH